MDRKTSDETIGLLALLIGEIMEDHVQLAVSAPLSAGAVKRLAQAGEDIGRLTAAMEVVGSRSESA